MSLPLRSLPPIYPKMTMRARYESQGWWVGKTKNASLEGRTEVSSSRECDGPIDATVVAPGPTVASYGLRARRQAAKPFSHHSRERHGAP